MSGAPSSYNALVASILAWLDNTDDNVNPSECIGLAEARFNRILDMPEMDAIITLSAAETVPVPGDFWSVRSLYINTDPRVTLEPVTPTMLRDLYPFQTTGMPQVYSIIQNNIVFGPTPDAEYDVELLYKATIPALSADTPSNWLLAKHPDLYLYGALMTAEARGWNDSRAALIRPLWDETMAEISAAGRRARYGSAPLRMRAPVRWGI